LHNLAHSNVNHLKPVVSLVNSAFSLENESEYQQWREAKLSRCQLGNPTRVVSVPAFPAVLEMPDTSFDCLSEQINNFNFAIFQIDSADEPWASEDFLEFGRKFGLNRLDYNQGAESNGVTLLSALDSSDRRSRYIPYTNRALNWHTDGYYNNIDASIGAFTLFCSQQAGQGGRNFLLDYELLYIQLRDAAPKLLKALMQPDIMVIPANIENNRVIRPAETGPVFSVDKVGGYLNMRFSARPQNIGWKSDALSERAINLVRELLIDNENTIELLLEPGQGVICNNVLHGRTSYSDNQPSEKSRLYFRARYYDRINLSGNDTVE
jgi:alpha-ketoglutarate-dependent taurine dioxygenase